MNDRHWAVDLETTSVDPLYGSILTCAVSNGQETIAWAIKNPSDLEQVKESLKYGCRPIVHYVPMESSWSEEYLGNDRHTGFIDTALLAYRVDPGEPMKLSSVVARHLPEFSGWKGSTEEQLAAPETGHSMLGVSEKDLLERNAVDACLTRRLHDVLWPKLTEEERKLHEEDVAISMFVSRMSRRGMHVSEERLIALRDECVQTMERETEWLRRATSQDDLNPGSTQQLGALFDLRGIPTIANVREYRQAVFNGVPCLPATDTGAVGTSGLALRLLRHNTSAPGVKEFIDHVLTFRKAQDRLGDNVTAYAQARDPYDGRIRGGFFWPGTTTWRPTCYAPNRLNVPRKGVRQVFSAPDGMVVLEYDLKQAEPRISAQVSQDPVMLHEFKEGIDPYVGMARKVYEKETISKDERQVGKVIYLAAEYGISEQSLWESMAKDDLIVPIELVRKGLRYYWKRYERLGEYIEEQEATLLRGDHVYAPTGGYRWNLDNMRLLHPKDEEEALRAGFNATIQSVPPRIVFRAALRLEDRFEIVNSVYDSLLMYVPADGVLDACRDVEATFREVVAEETWLKDVELPGEIKVGPSWGDLKEIPLTDLSL